MPCRCALPTAHSRPPLVRDAADNRSSSSCSPDEVVTAPMSDIPHSARYMVQVAPAVWLLQSSVDQGSSDLRDPSCPLWAVLG